MSTIAVFRFPGGRYHAPSWSRAGTVELPPSPWRLLREFHAVWRTRAPELGEETVHPLLARLAEPPTVHVPRHVILGSVAVFERAAELALRWPFDLDPAQHSALERLVSSIPYLGRADNACSGFLTTRWEPGSHDTWVPVDVAESVSAAPATTVLAPELPLQLRTLLAPPVEVRRAGLPLPAGAHLVAYQRCPREQVVTAVRYRVLQAGLPPQTESLIYTDLLHRGALSKLGVLRAERSHTLLGGRRADGKTMEGHRHAHYLPLITGQRVSGLVVWVPGELPADELTALTRVDRLYTPLNPDWRLTIRVAAVGAPTQVTHELVAQYPATVWRSVTPFTARRYPKRHASQPDYLHAEVSKELEYRELPTLRAVTQLDEEWRCWRRDRPSARMRRETRLDQLARESAFLRLELTEPVHGPLALGHLSHFGLGLFVPER